MNEKLNIPTQLKVGYNKRSDTYNGFLAFVTYLEKDNKIHREISFRSWIDKKKIDDYENIKISGFVLNKNTGSYKHDFGVREDRIRIFDPRNFEFEIKVPNLLYIIKNNGIGKGGELFGEFVYAWNGDDLILLPVDSIEYEKSFEHTSLVKSDKIAKRDLIPGHIYGTVENKNYIYLGDSFIYNFKKEQVQKSDYNLKQDSINKVFTIGKKFLIFKNEIKDSFETFSDTKLLRTDLGLSNTNAIDYLNDYINTHSIGAFEKFVFTDLTEKNLKDIKDKKCKSVFKIDGSVIKEFRVSSVYEKWGVKFNRLNISYKASYEIFEDYYLFHKSYIYISDYGDPRPKQEGFQFFMTDEEFLNQNFKIGKIKLSFGKDLHLSYR